MTNAAKFTFKNLQAVDGNAGGGHAQPPKKRVLTNDQILEIQETAFSDGARSGETAALLKIEKKMDQTLDQIAAQYSGLFTEVNEQMAVLRCQAAELALVIAKKFAPAVIGRFPEAEIENLFTSCVANLNAEPRIVIRVEESLLDALKEKIEFMARKAGYPGRVVIIGEPDARHSECRIEWVDGGVMHRSPDQLAVIDQLISAYVSGTSADECPSSPSGTGRELEAV